MKTKFIILFLILIFPSIYASFTLKEPTSWDWNNFHEQTIKSMIKGNFNNEYAYPLFFHFVLLIPYLLVGNSIKYFQIIISFLSILSIYFLVKKFENEIGLILMFGILSTCFIYAVWNSTLTPQALDFILFPIFIIFLFDKKYILCSIVLICLMYNHLFGLVYMLIVFIYSLSVEKKFLKYWFLVVLLSFPVIITYHIPTLLVQLNPVMINNFLEKGQFWINYKEMIYYKPIINLIIFTGINFLLLPISVYCMKKLKKFNKLQFLYALWCLCFVPIFFFHFARALSYFLIPLALFQSSIISRYFNDKK